MDTDHVWKLMVGLIVVIQVGINWFLWSANRIQGRFNGEVLRMLAVLREHRALHEAQDARGPRDARGGLKGR